MLSFETVSSLKTVLRTVFMKSEKWAEITEEIAKLWKVRVMHSPVVD